MNRFKRILRSILTHRPNWLRRKQQFQTLYFYYDRLGVFIVLAAVRWEGYEYQQYVQGQGLSPAQRKRIDRYNSAYPVYFGRVSVDANYDTYTLQFNLNQKDSQNDRH